MERFEAENDKANEGAIEDVFEPTPDEYLAFDPERDTHLYTPLEQQLVNDSLRIREEELARREARRLAGETVDEEEEDVDLYADFDEADEHNTVEDDAEVNSIFSRFSGGGTRIDRAQLKRQINQYPDDDDEPTSDYNWDKVSYGERQPKDAELREAIVQKMRMMHATLVKEGAEDIVVVDVTEKANFTDYMVVCSARSTRKLGHLGEALQICLQEFSEKMVEQGKDVGAEFYLEDFHQQQGWVTLDATDIVVHLQLPEVRDYYDIERLWAFENTNLKEAMERELEEAERKEEEEYRQKRLKIAKSSR